MGKRTCIGCKLRFEEDSSGLAPPGSYCSNDCVSKVRAERMKEIPAKHGITDEKFKAILKDFLDLPSYGRR